MSRAPSSSTHGRGTGLLASVLLALPCCVAGVVDGEEGSGQGGKSDDWGATECEGDSCLRDRDAVSIILGFDEHLTDDDRTAKHCAMASSPFVFFRGSNHLFWLDLGSDPRLAHFGRSDGDRATRIWIQGDLHVDNFGAFDDDEERIVYGLNDFDEAVVADYQLDLWRMATSLVLVAEQSGRFDREEIAEILDAFTESYLDAVASYRGNDDERSRVFTEESTRGRLDDFLREVEANESREEMLADWTVAVDGERVFDLESSKLEAPQAEVAAAIVEGMEDYQRTLSGGIEPSEAYFRVKDVARRLDAGTGSLGTPRYYVLIEGATDSQDDDRILDVKRQGPPAADAVIGPSPELVGAVASHAERAVLGHRALSAGADDLLGWILLPDGAYSVRERSPFKETFPVEELESLDRFVAMAEQWGEILATSHSRADQDFDPSIIGYSFDRNVDRLTDGRHAEVRGLVRAVAMEYARQVDADYQAFVDEVASRIACD